MTIATVTGASAAPAASSLYSTAPTTPPDQTMDSNMFMNLLVTQLQNQDPSSPMDTNDMITQTTELATMEKLTSMDTTSTNNYSLNMRTSAAALIGQQVSYIDANGNIVTGKATSVSFSGDTPQVTVGSQSVALDAISGITAS